MTTPDQRPLLVATTKRGDTLVLGCTALDALGAPVPLTGVTIRAQLRSERGALAATLLAEPVELGAGTFELHFPGTGRVAVAPGSYLVDIEYSALVGAGPREMARSSRTMRVDVLAGITA